MSNTLVNCDVIAVDAGRLNSDELVEDSEDFVDDVAKKLKKDLKIRFES